MVWDTKKIFNLESNDELHEQSQYKYLFHGNAQLVFKEWIASFKIQTICPSLAYFENILIRIFQD